MGQSMGRRLTHSAYQAIGRLAGALEERADQVYGSLSEAERLSAKAAQSEVVHNDDTSMRVLSLERDTDISPERTGVFSVSSVRRACHGSAGLRGRDSCLGRFRATSME